MRPTTTAQAPAPDITRHVGRMARVRFYGPDRIATIRTLEILCALAGDDGRPMVGCWEKECDPPRMVKVATEDVIEFALIEEPRP